MSFFLSLVTQPWWCMHTRNGWGRAYVDTVRSRRVGREWRGEGLEYFVARSERGDRALEWWGVLSMWRQRVDSHPNSARRKYSAISGSATLYCSNTIGGPQLTGQVDARHRSLLRPSRQLHSCLEPSTSNTTTTAVCHFNWIFQIIAATHTHFRPELKLFQHLQ